MRIASLILASLAAVYAAPTSHQPGKSLPVDWKLLSQAAGLSQQTYCFFQPDNQTVGDAQLLYEYGDGNFDQRAIVFKSKSLGIAVSFEGTEPISIASILHDADFQLVNPDKDLKEVFPPGVQVFKGFQDAYLAVARPVLSKVKEMMQKYNETRVTVTGHSLGAAMALLAAAHYEQTLKNGSVTNVFTFGQPRTGNPAFANAMDDKFLGKLFYVVNGKDWVPHMPPVTGISSTRRARCGSTPPTRRTGRSSLARRIRTVPIRWNQSGTSRTTTATTSTRVWATAPASAPPRSMTTNVFA